MTSGKTGLKLSSLSGLKSRKAVSREVDKPVSRSLDWRESLSSKLYQPSAGTANLKRSYAHSVPDCTLSS